MQVRFFESGDAQAWDAFCDSAYNATFLHSRRFLSYHGDRFVDRSLIVEEAGRWMAVLPAAQHPALGGLVVSHPGITYGGFVHQGALRGTAMISALRLAREAYAEAGFERLAYKAVPHIYHQLPAQDDLYALFRLGAQRVRCDLSSCIDLGKRLPLSERRRRSLKKASGAGLLVRVGNTYLAALWDVLSENLVRKHGTKPTHTLPEIEELARRFPDEIRTVVACKDERVVAGVVLFDCGQTVHAQYIASSEEGYGMSALDLVFSEVIAEAGNTARYFDFGISTEEQGQILNDGLYRFKSEFGASGIVHEFYELSTKDDA